MTTVPSEYSIIYIKDTITVYQLMKQQELRYLVVGSFNYAAATVFNVVVDTEYRKRWDSYCKEIEVLEQLGEDEMVIYAQFATLEPCEYIWHRTTQYNADEGNYTITSTAVEHSHAKQCNRILKHHCRTTIQVEKSKHCSFRIEYEEFPTDNSQIIGKIGNITSIIPIWIERFRHACQAYAEFIHEKTKLLLPSHRLITSLKCASNSLIYEDLEDDFRIIFNEDKLQISFTRNDTGVSVVSSDEPVSKDVFQQIYPGVIVSSINKQSILKSEETMEQLLPDVRPIELGFMHPYNRNMVLSTDLLLYKYETTPGMIRLVLDEHNTFDALFRSVKAKRGAQTKKKAILSVYFMNKANNQIDKEQIQLSKNCVLVSINNADVQECDTTTILERLVTLTNPYVAITLKLPKQKSPLRKIPSPVRGLRSMRQSISRKLQTNQSNPAVQAFQSMDDGGDVELMDDYSTVTIDEKNVTWALKHAKALFYNERIISANNMFIKLEKFLSKPQNSSNFQHIIGEMEMEPLKGIIALVKERGKFAMDALFEFNTGQEAGWNFAQKYFGVSTYWKPGDDGTVWLKLDGICEDVEVFDCLAVLRETDLYNLWAPFCNKSALLKYLARIEIITYMNVAIPLMQRDAVIHAFGIDASYEYGCVVILGNSVKSWEGVDNIPPPPKSLTSDRMEINGFRALVEPLTRTSGRTCVVANIDPKCPVPQSLLNFCIKKMAGILLYMLIKEAEKIAKDPDHNVYAQRIREDPTGFYTWLKPKMVRFFDQLENGTLPQRLELSCSKVEKQPMTPRLSTSSSLRNSISTPGNFPMPDEFSVLRPKYDYLYDIIFWPYVLVILQWMIPLHWSILIHGAFKLFVSNVTWWLGVGSMACQWEDRFDAEESRVIEHRRLEGLKLVTCGCMLNTLLVWLSAQYVAVSDPMRFEKHWLLVSSSTFASAIVGIIVIKRLQLDY